MSTVATYFADALIIIGLVLLIMVIILHMWETITLMWQRSDTFRPFLLATIEASIAVVFTIMADGSTFREVFSLTFELERKRARGQLR